MPIVAFENRRPATLNLVIEPKGERYEVPHLATVGIRYSLDEEAEDRCTSVVGEDDIEFWCDAATVEVDIVHALPISRLLWDICVQLGFCGGIVEGKPTHVQDLIPGSGFISAQAFAELAISAEGGEPETDEARLRHWRDILAAKFVEHLGGAVAPVEALRGIERRPFDPPPSGR
jgi:hypothetical protein